MKTLSTLVLLALICFLHRSSAEPRALEMFEVCCESHTQIRIPKPKVKHVMETSKICQNNPRNTEAILVTTVCDEKYCIDPETRWAKHVLKEFQKFTANNTSIRAPFNRSKCNKP